LSEFIQYFGTHYLGKTFMTFRAKYELQDFFYCDLFVPARCRCRGLLSHVITLNETHTHIHTHTHTHTHTHGRTPLEEVSTRRRHLYWATHTHTHNTHNRADIRICHRQDSNPPAQQASGRTPLIQPSYRYEIQFLGENAYKYVKLA
jgi:hypothetical protein